MSQHHRKQWNGNDSAKARARIKAGPPVQQCIRCGGPIRIADGKTWDAGHLVDLAEGGDAHRYGPEHRHRTGACPGNRAAGGRAGARLTNAKRGKPTTPKDDRIPKW